MLETLWMGIFRNNKVRTLRRSWHWNKTSCKYKKQPTPNFCGIFNKWTHSKTLSHNNKNKNQEWTRLNTWGGRLVFRGSCKLHLKTTLRSLECLVWLESTAIYQIKWWGGEVKKRKLMLTWHFWTLSCLTWLTGS